MKRIIAKLLILFNIHFVDKEKKKVIYAAIKYTIINSKQRYSICELLKIASDSIGCNYEGYGMHILFPEIYVEKPLLVDPKFNGLWWNKYNRIERKESLTKALNRL